MKELPLVLFLLSLQFRGLSDLLLHRRRTMGTFLKWITESWACDGFSWILKFGSPRVSKVMCWTGGLVLTSSFLRFLHGSEGHWSYFQPKRGNQSQIKALTEKFVWMEESLELRVYVAQKKPKLKTPTPGNISWSHTFAVQMSKPHETYKIIVGKPKAKAWNFQQFIKEIRK